MEAKNQSTHEDHARATVYRAIEAMMRRRSDVTRVEVHARMQTASAESDRHPSYITTFGTVQFKVIARDETRGLKFGAAENRMDGGRIVGCDTVWPDESNPLSTVANTLDFAEESAVIVRAAQSACIAVPIGGSLIVARAEFGRGVSAGEYTLDTTLTARLPPLPAKTA